MNQLLRLNGCGVAHEETILMKMAGKKQGGKKTSTSEYFQSMELASTAEGIFCLKSSGFFDVLVTTAKIAMTHVQHWMVRVLSKSQGQGLCDV